MQTAKIVAGLSLKMLASQRVDSDQSDGNRLIEKPTRQPHLLEHAGKVDSLFRNMLKNRKAVLKFILPFARWTNARSKPAVDDHRLLAKLGHL